ncbi:hypothetical protein CXF54_12510 [Olleya sp. 1-3]|nr:hypothetical protein CXF54_12510 [Olleya sp. 1-3]
MFRVTINTNPSVVQKPAKKPPKPPVSNLPTTKNDNSPITNMAMPLINLVLDGTLYIKLIVFYALAVVMASFFCCHIWQKKIQPFDCAQGKFQRDPCGNAQIILLVFPV